MHAATKTCRHNRNSREKPWLEWEFSLLLHKTDVGAGLEGDTQHFMFTDALLNTYCSMCGSTQLLNCVHPLQ